MIIDDFIAGKVSAEQFASWIQESPEHMALVDELVISEAKENPSYKLYTGYEDETGTHRPYSFEVMREMDFSLVNLLRRNKAFDGNLGDDYNLYESVYRFYILSHPGCPHCDTYKNRVQLYLAAIGEYYGGPEVESVIEDIVDEALLIHGKTNQKTYVKNKMKQCFHIEGNNRPYWIQGAEWPMGKNSPMQYVSKQKKGEEHLYLFRDVDTGEERIVTQLW